MLIKFQQHFQIKWHKKPEKMVNRLQKPKRKSILNGEMTAAGLPSRATRKFFLLENPVTLCNRKRLVYVEKDVKDIGTDLSQI